MSRIAERFAQLRRTGRTALIPYLTAGDPEPAATVPLLQAVAAAGADLIELGVPFSDPMADGPVIQAACERALAQQTRLSDVLDMAADFRRQDPDTPLILMTYCNPIAAMGERAFAAAAARAGVDGTLVVDLPPEEAQAVRDALLGEGLDPIFLLAPTSSDERIGKVAAQACGYIYYVSLRGTTGADRLDFGDAAQCIARIRAQTSLPIGIGFGIKDAADAARAAALADAVIVGSALVQAAHEADDACAAATTLMRDLRRGLDACATQGGAP